MGHSKKPAGALRGSRYFLGLMEPVKKALETGETIPLKSLPKNFPQMLQKKPQNHSLSRIPNSWPPEAPYRRFCVGGTPLACPHSIGKEGLRTPPPGRKSHRESVLSFSFAPAPDLPWAPLPSQPPPLRFSPYIKASASSKRSCKETPEE